MGFDIYGKSKGISFHCSIWSWPALLGQIARISEEKGLGIDFTGWECNDGNGLDDKKKCLALADALEEAFRPGDKIMALPGTNTQSGEAIKAFFGLTNTKYEIRPHKFQEFIQFLRECGGGFEIW